MKLLFDENISYRIVKKLKSLFPESKQVSDLNLEGLTDRRIWNYAKEEHYTIVTFDADFYDLVTLYGHPPKVMVKIGKYFNSKYSKSNRGTF